MGMITVLCVYLAVPGAAHILVTVLAWVLTAAAVMIVLMLLQSPLLLLVKRHTQRREDEDK
jgi:hypothetical protein